MSARDALIAEWFAPLPESQFWRECFGRASVLGSLAGAPQWKLKDAVGASHRARVHYPAPWLLQPDHPASAFYFSPELMPLFDLGATLVTSAAPPRAVARFMTRVERCFGSSSVSLVACGGLPPAALEAGPGLILVPITGRSRWKVHAPLVLALKQKLVRQDTVTLAPGAVLYGAHGARLISAAPGSLLLRITVPSRAALEPQLRQLLMNLWGDDVFREPAMMPATRKGKRRALEQATDRVARLRRLPARVLGARRAKLASGEILGAD